MGKVEICDMTLADYEQIKEQLMIEFDDFWTPNMLKSELLSENRKYIVAKIEKEIIGFAGVMFSPPELEIMNIVTKKTERNKGIGMLLLEKIIKIAKENRIEEIMLEVNEKNVPAIHLYEKAGFQRIGLRKKYYHGLENAILMSKK